MGIFALSWQRLHGIYGSPGEVFQPHTAAIVRRFDGRHLEGQIFAALPPTLTGLFRPAFLDRLLHPQGRLLRALEANDVSCDWRPATPVRLFYAAADGIFIPRNTAVCAAALRRRGGTVGVTDLGHLGHIESAVASAPRMLAWLAARPG